MKYYFSAPWDKLLFFTSFVFVVLILLPIVYIPSPIGYGLTILLILSALPFIITGYTIQDKKLFIHRLGWKNIYELSELEKIEINPEAMKNSLRLFGIGGAFTYSGIFSNKLLGKYHAYATCKKNCVILYLRKKTIVVTPDRPQEFIQAINNLK